MIWLLLLVSDWPIIMIWLLLLVSDWLIIMIGPGSLLLGSSLPSTFAILQSQVSIVMCGVGRKQITKLRCEKYFCRNTYWAQMEIFSKDDWLSPQVHHEIGKKKRRCTIMACIIELLHSIVWKLSLGLLIYSWYSWPKRDPMYGNDILYKKNLAIMIGPKWWHFK
jgi:hypothetical protein